MPHTGASTEATEHLRGALTVWQIATGPPLRHLPGMRLPFLLADVTTIGLDTVIPAGAVLVVGGSLLAWARSSTTTENHVKTLQQDLNAQEQALKSEREAFSKQVADLVHRVTVLENQSARSDERMLGVQGSIQELRKGMDRMDGKLDQLLDMERATKGGRRRDDAA